MIAWLDHLTALQLIALIILTACVLGGFMAWCLCKACANRENGAANQPNREGGER